MGGSGSKAKKPEPTKVDDKQKPKPATAQEVPPEQPKYGTYTPFTEFPTPGLLAQAQRDYTAANVERKLDEKGIPLPFPPPQTKAEVFRQEEYQHIDEYARNAPLELGGRTFEELANYLMIPARNDIGKVRAFFVWIANQGLQRLKVYEARNGFPQFESPLFVIAAIIYNRRAGNYPDLLANLCGIANIPCKIVINDKAKASGYDVGDEDLAGYTRHCLVYVDKAWRIINQHWGSEGVITKTNTDWEYQAGKKKILVEDFQIVYHCNDFYFLTDPEVYIYENWTSNTSDQLLARPVSEREFIEMAHLDVPFHQLGLTSIDPPKCRIIAEAGQAVIKIGLTSGKKYKFDFTLYKSKYLAEYNEVDGVPLERYVLMERKGDIIQVTVNLRKYGKHKLELDACWEDDYTCTFCDYLIDCQKPNSICQPNPEASNLVMGLGFNADKFGLMQTDDTGGVVIAKNGQAQIRLRRVTHKSIVYWHQIFNDQVKREEMKHNVRHYITENEVVVDINLPQVGQYVYELYGKDEDDTSNQKLRVAAFILQADRGVAELYPYPRSDGPEQQIGDLIVSDEKYLVPESHPRPIILLENASELLIEMKILRQSLFTASLKFSSEAQQEIDFSEFLLTEKTSGVLSFNLRFPKVGMYKLTIQADRKTIYQYLIQVKEVLSDILPYPRNTGKTLLDGLKLLEPRSQYIELEKNEKFSLQMANAVAVTVIGETVTQLQRLENNKDTWEGYVKTGIEERDIDVFVKSDKDTEPKLVFSYQAKSSQFIDRQRKEQERLAKRGKEQMERNRQIDEKKTSEANKKAKDLEKQKKEQDEYFEKNKKKFEAEEKLFDEKEAEVKKAKAEDEIQFSSEKYDEAITHEELENQAIAEEETAKKRLQEWQIKYEEMQKKMARERLRQAAIANNLDKLKAAVDECHGYEFDDDEIRAAEYLLVCLQASQDLGTACETKDIAEIEKAIDKIIADGLERPLEIDIKNAEREILKLKKLRGVKPFDIDRKTLSEVKSYLSPSPPLHTVIQAAFLLLGFDEEFTKEWKQCQGIITTIGKGSLLQRILEIKPQTLNLETCARARVILKAVAQKAMERGAAAATFYIWAMGVIEEAKKINDWDDAKFSSDAGRQEQIS